MRSTAHRGLASPGVGRALIALIKATVDTGILLHETVEASEVKVYVALVIQGVLLGDAVGRDGVGVEFVAGLLEPLADVTSFVEVSDHLDVAAGAGGESGVDSHNG